MPRNIPIQAHLQCSDVFWRGKQGDNLLHRVSDMPTAELLIQRMRDAIKADQSGLYSLDDYLSHTHAVHKLTPAQKLMNHVSTIDIALYLLKQLSPESLKKQLPGAIRRAFQYSVVYLHEELRSLGHTVGIFQDPTFDGYTFLSLAVQHKHIPWIQTFIEEGVNVFAAPKEGQKTVFDIAILEGHPALAHWLLTGQALPESCPISRAVLDYVLQVPDFEKYKLLLSKITRFVDQETFKALLNQPNHEGLTPLLTAIRNQKQDVFIRLIAHPDVNLCYADWMGKTALHWIAQGGNIPYMKELLPRIITPLYWKKTFTIDLVDKLGRTPLHWAALYGRTEMIAFLLEQKAQPHPQDNEGKTPLKLARQAELATAYWQYQTFSTPLCFSETTELPLLGQLSDSTVFMLETVERFPESQADLSL